MSGKKNFKKLNTVKSCVLIGITGSLLAACQSSNDTMSSSSMDTDQEYEMLSMKRDSDKFNASASKSAIVPHPVEETAETVETPEPVDYVAIAEDVLPEEETVHFEFDSAELTSAAKMELDELADAANDVENVVVNIQISGHADAIGSDAYNEQLSMERAESVKDYLSTEISFTNVEWDLNSYGEDRPVANNSTADGRQENRRVKLDVSIEPSDQTAMNL